MQSPNQNGLLTADDYLLIYCNVFNQELHGIISSGDYKPYLADISRTNKRKIKENHERLAEIAANYFIQNDGSDLEDESAVEKLFRESISYAIREILNG